MLHDFDTPVHGSWMGPAAPVVGADPANLLARFDSKEADEVVWVEWAPNDPENPQNVRSVPAWLAEILLCIVLTGLPAVVSTTEMADLSPVLRFYGRAPKRSRVLTWVSMLTGFSTVGRLLQYRVLVRNSFDDASAGLLKRGRRRGICCVSPLLPSRPAERTPYSPSRCSFPLGFGLGPMTMVRTERIVELTRQLTFAPSAPRPHSASMLERRAGALLTTSDCLLLTRAYGRYPMYLASALVYLLMFVPIGAARNIVRAISRGESHQQASDSELNSQETVIIARLIAGVAASSGGTLVGGTVADLFDSADRGLPMALYSFAA